MTSKPDYAEMGLRIRKARRDLNLTQEKLAEAVGISPSFLGHIERGTRVMSIETLAKISAETHLEPGFILQGNSTPPQDKEASEAAQLVSQLSQIIDQRMKDSIDKLTQSVAEEIARFKS